MLLQEGFKRTSPKPVHLEATKASTRDIYAHFGFEASPPSTRAASRFASF